MAIQSFGDRRTEEFFATGTIARGLGWSHVASIAKRKLDMLDYAGQLIDLRSPPGNRLEKLSGALRGFHSIRINDQWRIIFRWSPAGPIEVRIADYH